VRDCVSDIKRRLKELLQREAKAWRTLNTNMIVILRDLAHIKAVCRIRIRSDPELFAGSGSAVGISYLEPERIRNTILD